MVKPAENNDDNSSPRRASAIGNTLSNRLSVSSNRSARLSVANRLSARLSIGSIRSMLSRGSRSHSSSNPLYVPGEESSQANEVPDDSNTVSPVSATADALSETDDTNDASSVTNRQRKESRRSSVDVLQAIVDDMNKESDAKSAGIPHFNQDNFFQSSPSDAVLEATVTLRKFLSVGANNDHIRTVMKIPNVVTRLVHLMEKGLGLTNSDPKCISLRHEASWALTNIASGDSEFTQKVAEANALQVGKGILSDPDTNLTIKDQVIWMISNIAGDSVLFRDQCLELGIHLLVIKFLGKDSVRAHRQASWCMSNFFRGKPCPELDFAVPCLAPILACIKETDDVQVKNDCYFALAYVADGPDERINAVLDVEGLAETVVSELQELTKGIENKVELTPADIVLSPALRLAGNIVTGTDTQTQQMVDAGLIPTVHNLLLTKPSLQIAKESWWLLSNITAGTLGQIGSVRNQGLFPYAVASLKWQHPDVCAEIMWFIANAMDADPDNCGREFVECGGLGGVLHAVKATTPNSKHQTVVLLQLFCERFLALKEELGVEKVAQLHRKFVNDLLTAVPSSAIKGEDSFSIATSLERLNNQRIAGEPNSFGFEEHVTFIMNRIGIVPYDLPPVALELPDSEEFLMSTFLQSPRLRSAYRLLLCFMTHKYDEVAGLFNDLDSHSLVSAALQEPTMIWVLSMLVEQQHPVVDKVVDYIKSAIANAHDASNFNVDTLDDFLNRLPGVDHEYRNDIVSGSALWWTILGVLNNSTLNDAFRKAVCKLPSSANIARHTALGSSVWTGPGTTESVNLQACVMVGIGSYLSLVALKPGETVNSSMTLFAQTVAALLNWGDTRTSLLLDQDSTLHVNNQDLFDTDDIATFVSQTMPTYLESAIKVPFRRSFEQLAKVENGWKLQVVDESTNKVFPNSSTVLLQFLQESLGRDSVMEFLFHASLSGFPSSNGQAIFVPTDLARSIAEEWCSFQLS